MQHPETWHYGCPASETYIKRAGVTVSRCRNLRALTRYSSPVVRVESRFDPFVPGNVRGDLRVTYADGAQGFASFASYHIMIDWIRKRRGWRGIEHVMQGPDLGYLTRPGVIAGEASK